MKNIFFLTCFLISNLFSFSQENINTILTQNSDSILIRDNSQIIANEQIDFIAYQDERTLKYFEQGKIHFEFKWVGEPYKWVGIQYREINEVNWRKEYFELSNNFFDFDSIQINEIFEYKISFANQKNEIDFSNLESNYFNSIHFSIFENKYAIAKTNGVKIIWAISNEKLNQINNVYPEAKFLIKYNTSIGAEQNKSDKSVSPWVEIDSISLNTVTYEFSDLVGGEQYKYNIGLDLGNNQIVWSGKENDKGKFTTKRSWGLFKLLVLLGSLGMFIYGMKNMSEGLQKSAGAKLRNMLAAITSNRFKGVLTGFGITSIVQSSSVTTVMTVSFVNAGLMTLRQSAGVMMGANIGTTITAWLIVIFGFKLSLANYSFIFIAFGASLLFFGKGKIKNWGGTLIGFALLFLGLDELKNSVPELGPDSSLVQFFINFKDEWYAPVMFVFLGAILTVVVQSSSAAMALTMILVSGGVLPFEVASAMILGENIGTTITAELASLPGNVHAKRSARIHSLFNIIGVFWALLLFPFLLKLIGFFMKEDPFTNPEAANTGLAIFHTMFNTLNVLILIGFVPKLVSLAEKTVKSKGGFDEEFHLDYIGTGIMVTPELSILEAKKEIAKFGDITSRMNGFTQKLLKEQNKKAKSKLYDKIEKYEEITDRVEIEIANYLSKVSEGEMSEQTSKKIQAMNSIVNDLERIGDLYYQMSKTIERKESQKIWFLPEQRNSLQEMFQLVGKAFNIMVENLNDEWEKVDLNEAKEAENDINKKRNKMRKEHFENMGKKNLNIESLMIFNNLFSSCEKVGDHIINVSEAITGKI